MCDLHAQAASLHGFFQHKHMIVTERRGQHVSTLLHVGICGYFLILYMWLFSYSLYLLLRFLVFWRNFASARTKSRTSIVREFQPTLSKHIHACIHERVSVLLAAVLPYSSNSCLQCGFIGVCGTTCHDCISPYLVLWSWTVSACVTWLCITFQRNDGSFYGDLPIVAFSSRHRR